MFIMRFLRQTTYLFLLIWIFVSGCSVSTTFKPNCDHKIYLTLDKNEYVIIKDGLPERLSGNPENLLTCDTMITAMMKDATKYLKKGQSLSTVAVAVGLFSFLGSAILMGEATIAYNTSVARLIDVMNIHNDKSRCVFPNAPQEESQNAELVIPSTTELFYNTTSHVLNGQVKITCLKKKESLFVTTTNLSFDGVIGIDRHLNGSFERRSLKIEQGDVFYIRTIFLLLRAEVTQKTDNSITLALQKQ